MRFLENLGKHKDIILALAILFLAFSILLAGAEIADAIFYFAELYAQK